MMHRQRPAPPNGGKDGMHRETDLNELMQGGEKDGNANEPDLVNPANAEVRTVPDIYIHQFLGLPVYL